MTISYDETALLRRVRGLAPRNRAAFAVACAFRTRAYFGYPANTPVAPELDKALEALERCFDRGGEIDSMTAAVTACEEHLDPDDNAVAGVIYASQAEEPQAAVWCARRAYEARDRHVIDSLALDLNSLGAEQRVLAHPIVQAELQSQHSDLNILETTGDAAIQILAAARDAGKSRPTI